VDVGEGATCEVVALLVGDDPSLGTDRAQQGQGERTRSGAGLEHPAPGIDVGPEQDHGKVFRIDHLRATGHLEDVFGQRGTEREVTQAHGAADPRGIGLADDHVVGDPATVGVERLRLAEKDQVTLATLIDEQDLLAVLKRRALVHDVVGRGRKRATRKPTAGRSALIQSTVGTP
jgi:hypothetical protein